MTKRQIKEDLIFQLKAQGKEDSYFLDLIDKYLDHFDTVKQLRKDVKKRGVLVEVTSGNGFTTMKHNESITLIQKEEKAMADILKLLEIHKPVIAESSDDDYL